jgi:CubicO group peptidase (beta-lactamase class C family)
MTLGRFVKQNIFDPLGMKNTFILDDNTVIIKNRATGYSPKDGRFRVDETLNESTGDGGVYTTVEDFFFWDQNFVHGTVGGPDFVADLLRPGRLNDGRPATRLYRNVPVEYAFGIACSRYRGLRTIGHSGAYVGFKAKYTRFPDQQFAIIFLSNRSDIDPQQFCQRIADICLEDSFTEKSPTAENAMNPADRPESPPLSISLKDLSAYPGDYWSSDLDVIYKLRLQGGNLVFVQEGAPPQASLAPKGDDLFSYWFMLLKFHRDPQSVIRGFSIESDRLKGIFFTRRQ